MPTLTGRACPPGATKFIFVRAPSNSFLTTDFALPAQFVDDIYLRIPVDPNEYTRLIEGEKSKLTRTYSAVRFSPRLARIGFKATCAKISNFNVYAALKYISQISASTTYATFTSVQVVDYLSPEIEDYKAAIIANTIPFTTRYGILSVDDQSGSIGTKGNDMYLAEGFSFSFLEDAARLVI